MRRHQSGFSLLEMLVAVLIFSMVIAGFAVIYGSAFKQGFRTIQAADLRAMGAVSSRAIQNELSQATMLGWPLAGNSANSLRGYTNVTRSTGALRNSLNPDLVWNPGQAGWFHFCVQTAASANCPADPAMGRGCLVGYLDGVGYNTNAIVCGTPAGAGSTMMVLSDWLKVDTGPPASSAYFSRLATDGVESSSSAVRVNFRLFRPPTLNTMLIVHDVDKTIKMNFSEDNPD